MEGKMSKKTILQLLVLFLCATYFSQAAPVRTPDNRLNINIPNNNPTGVILQAYSPDEYCSGKWQGPLGGYVDSWFGGNEYYAIYQDPAELGCTDTYPFQVTKIIWPIYTDQVISIEVKPIIYSLAGTPECPRPGDIIYEGPLMTFENLEAGGQYIFMDLEEPVCVYEPYFAGFYFSGQESNLNIYVDDGMIVAPRECAAYNDYGYGWRDLVAQENFEWNMYLWSEGYNSLENDCADSCSWQYPGDVNSDDTIDEDDITCLTDYLYREGAAPEPLANGDADGDCRINKADAYAIYDHINSAGILAECTCVHPETSCCYDKTGNADCSWEEEPDISDITRLIDFLYIMHWPLCCLAEADVDGSGGSPDISDITFLIAHLYIDHRELPYCSDYTPPAGEITGHTDCKTVLLPDEKANTETCVEYQYANRVLTLKHINAELNCCPVFTANITNENYIITIEEIDSLDNGGCDCICLFDIDYEISALPPGEYTISFIEPYLRPGEGKLEFTVNLVTTPSGSYCVPRL